MSEQSHKDAAKRSTPANRLNYTEQIAGLTIQEEEFLMAIAKVQGVNQNAIIHYLCFLDELLMLQAEREQFPLNPD